MHTALSRIQTQVTMSTSYNDNYKRLYSKGTVKQLNRTFIRRYFNFKFNYIGLEGRVFANGPGDRGSNPSRVIPKTRHTKDASYQRRVIPKTLKMVLDTSLLNTQQYKVRIKGKMEQSRESSSAIPYTSV